jgi:preprotein translocase subunit SecG
MQLLAQMSWGQFGMAVLLISVCLFLMLVILIQRGRGGGLVGAFGGAGGMSAFGAKTGDVFTWITVVVAAIFVLLSVFGNFVFDQSKLPELSAASTTTVDPIDTDELPIPGAIPITPPPPGTGTVKVVPGTGSEPVKLMPVDPKDLPSTLTAPQTPPAGAPSTTPPAGAQPSTPQAGAEPSAKPADSPKEGTAPPAGEAPKPKEDEPKNP